jgi:glycine/D-amino acid oxidase-like deaminating enzyme
MAHVVVVGAGVFGVWTAHFLRASGISVTLIDAYGPGHSRSSSGDESRILRCGYGPDALYTRFARRSRELWQELQTSLAPHESPIWWPCGVLWLARGPDAYVDATRDTLTAEGCSVEVLETATLTARYPHIQASAVSSALLEPDCGVLMARRAVQFVCSELIAGGTKYIRGHVRAPAVSKQQPILRLAMAARSAQTRSSSRAAPGCRRCFPSC